MKEWRMKTYNLGAMNRRKEFLVCIFVSAIALLVPGLACAQTLTPIARWDTVPNQRITNGEVLNVAVVAFSKAGMNDVTFTVTGQGYTGLSPIQITAMTYNEQTKVYEYWFPLEAINFSTNGVFTISAVANGKDAGTKPLDTLSFVVNRTGTLGAPKAWVSTTGSNSTGKVGVRASPFATLGGAVSAIQASNGGSSDGATIYLFEGSYALGNGSVSTANEWITITKDANARKESTVVTGAGSIASTSYLRLKDITIQGSPSGSSDFATKPAKFWVDSCVIQGGGRYVVASNPTIRGGSAETDYPIYCTDTQIYNVDYGMQIGMLARNVTVKHTGNDPFVNVRCIINAVVDDVDPGSTYWHADGYQSWGAGPQNRIIYGYYGTNLHYQGLFMRQTVGNPANNNAFINMFIEMCPPGRPGNAGGVPVLTAGTLNGAYDHLLMWNCTFIGTDIMNRSSLTDDFGVYNDPDGVPLSFANCSFIGNVFEQYVDYEAGDARINPSYSLPGNSGHNEFLFNHFVYSNVDQGGGVAGKPHWRSKSPDSGVTTTHTFGLPGIDLSSSSPIGAFGVPLPASPLLNRITPPLVPTDALGRLRDASADVGALERLGNEPLPSADSGKLKGLRIESGSQ
jgi:hypothetical protein